MDVVKLPGRSEDEEEEEDFINKKGGDGKGGEVKANTPRSKHSATEQRRRSKINDRFQILRDLIPQNDQKRDKASFLLEVIEYIQFLQEKVHKYEASYQGWNQEPTKLTPWRNGHGIGETIFDHSRAMKQRKFEENSVSVLSGVLPNAQNPLESDLSSSTAYKPIEHQPGPEHMMLPLLIPQHATTFTSMLESSSLAQPPEGPIYDVDNMPSQPEDMLSRPTEFRDTNETINEQEELTMEGGTISIAGAYSQGLLNNLTQALQSLGVDVSQASISVQVDYGKRAINRMNTMTCGDKDHEDPSFSNRAVIHSRDSASGEDSDVAQKRLKTGGHPV